MNAEIEKINTYKRYIAQTNTAIYHANKAQAGADFIMDGQYNYVKGICEDMSNVENTLFPSHVNRIVNELDDAIDSLSGVPGAEGIISELNGVCDICAGEIKRYEGIAEVMDAFYKEVQATDIALKERINKLFQEEYVDRDYQYMLNRVKNHMNITVVEDISKMAAEMELSVEEMSDMVALQSYIQELEKMTSEEREKELEELKTLKNPSLWQSTIIKSVKGKSEEEINKLFGGMGNTWNFLESLIIAKRGGKLSEDEIALLKNQIIKNEKKMTQLSTKINKYTTKDSYKYKRIEGWKNKIDNIQGRLNYDMETGKIENRNKNIGELISGIQIVCVVGSDFYDNIIAHGMEGEDFIEDTIINLGEIGITYLASAGATYLAVETGGKLGIAVGGPIGAIIGIGAGFLIGGVYSGLKDDFHNAIEDGEDWWQQCRW